MGVADWLQSVLRKVSTPRGEARGMTALSAMSPYNVTPGNGPLGNINFSYGGKDWFGPLPPLKPIAPPQVAGREWDFIPGYNLTTEPRPYEPISFATLKGLVESYDPLRLVIERRKDQMVRLPWTIRPKQDPFSAKKRPSLDKLSAKDKARIKEILQFFKKPDRENTFSSWFRSLLDDHFVIDAPTLWCERNPANGDLTGLRIMDGSTIKRVIDEWGRTPEPIVWDGEPVLWNGELVTEENWPSLGFKMVPGYVVASQLPRGMSVPKSVLLPPAYQQILKGLPAVDYTTWDLLYRPSNLRPGRVYGLSPVEQVVLTVNIALRRAFHQLEYYREGNQPEGVFGVPESWQPDQVAKFQEYWDNLFRGNLGNRRTMKFVPAGAKSSYVPFKEPALKSEYDEWLARIVCFAFSYPPTAFVALANRSIAEQHDKTGEEEGLQPTKQWACDIFNEILEREFDSADLEFAYVEEDEVDQEAQAEILTTYQGNGGLSLNELRNRIGEEPSSDPAADLLMVKTANGLVPIGANTLDAQVEKTKAMQALAPKPEPGAPKPPAGGGKQPSAKGAKPVTKRANGDVEIYLIRHGKTKMNNTTDRSADRIRGWSDVPLTAEGRDEVAETAKKLKDAGIEVMVSSDLDRAKETAEIVGDAIGVTPISSKQLRPWDVGKLTGESTETALPKLEDYARNKPDEATPGGESFNSFRLRAFAGVAAAIEKAGDQKLAIVTHHRVERLMKAWIKGGMSRDGEIDLDTFLQKGAAPAKAETLKIDTAALAAAAKKD